MVQSPMKGYEGMTYRVCFPRPGYSVTFILQVALLLLNVGNAVAAELASPAVQKVASSLKGPCAVALRPDGAGDLHEIFVADAGAGKVVKFLSSNPGKSIDVVSGFAIPQPSKAGSESRGIQSLLFLDHLRLIVTGADDDGQPFFQMYELPESETPLSADQHKSDVRFAAGNKDDGSGIRTLPGIARAQPNEKFGDVVIVPSRADTGSDGLVFIPVRAGMLAEPAAVQLTNPGSDLRIGTITLSKSGYIVLAGRRGNSEEGSVLAFVNPLDRRVVMQVPIELERITALAYSPKTSNLYAASSPTNHDRDGIFRVDAIEKDGAPACKLEKIASVESPTALAFSPFGTLYVTSSRNDSLWRMVDVP
jgi:hypothetical protein